MYRPNFAIIVTANMTPGQQATVCIFALKVFVPCRPDTAGTILAGYVLHPWASNFSICETSEWLHGSGKTSNASSINTVVVICLQKLF